MPQPTALPTSAPVGVIGAGAMGAGIAQVAAQAGHSVTLYDAREGAASEAISTIARQLARRVERGKLEAGERHAILARLTAAIALDDLADCRLVIEAIVESLEAKQALMIDLEALCSPQTLLASNTSSLSITAIGAPLKHPERLAGLHFFNPAPVMKLVEVVSGIATDTLTARALLATAEAWGKVAVHASSTPGFIVNRVARPYYAESLRLLEEGVADPATLDHLLRAGGGFAMGPFALMDLIGHDVNYAVTRSVFDAYYQDRRYLPSLIQQELVQAGRLGRKSGRGFYDYRDGATPSPARLAPTVAAKAPDTLAVADPQGPLRALIARALQHGCQALDAADIDDPCGLRLGALHLRQCDGRCASERARDEGLDAVVLFDLCHDYASATAIALSASHRVAATQRDLACAFFQRLGFEVVWLDDTPGLVVMRTVAMLANEAADAVLQGVASARDVDRAMRFGVNYPSGPLGLGPGRRRPPASRHPPATDARLWRPPLSPVLPAAPTRHHRGSPA